MWAKQNLHLYLVSANTNNKEEASIQSQLNMLTLSCQQDTMEQVYSYKFTIICFDLEVHVVIAWGLTSISNATPQIVATL